MTPFNVDVAGSFVLDTRLYQSDSGRPRRQVTLGGSGWLMARALRAAGARVRLLAPVGQDVVGRFLFEFGARNGIVVVDTAVTGSAAGHFRTTIGSDLDVEIEDVSVVPEWDLNRLSRSLRTTADIRLLGHMPLAVLEAALAIPANYVVFNPSSSAIEEPTMWRTIRTAATRLRSVTSLNAAELEFLKTSVTDLLTSSTPDQIVVVTRGPDGASAFDGGDEIRCASQVTVAINPLGAGDALIAAMSVGLLAGNTTHEALRSGSDAAALVCSSHLSHDPEAWRDLHGEQWEVEEQ